MCELLRFRHYRKRGGKIAAPAIDCGPPTGRCFRRQRGMASRRAAPVGGLATIESNGLRSLVWTVFGNVKGP